jgi:predicted ATPase
MIQKISIKNFKSVHSNDMELGRFNVLIGENGSGKSNILEAIAFGGAAAVNLLDNEFLASRGIRVTRPELIFSAFSYSINRVSRKIDIEYNFGPNKNLKYEIYNSIKKGWVEKNFDEVAGLVELSLIRLVETISGTPLKVETEEDKESAERSKQLQEKIKANPTAWKKKFDTILDSFDERSKSTKFNVTLRDFTIYSPENTSLRNFFDEGQITPLGIRGEGLFSLLKEISQEKKGSRFKKIIESLKIIDWFDGFELGANGFPGEKVIKIKDKYITDSIQYIDQRSTNEGFLFLLFYITLFVSDKTPEFFAIDNIEASFNPKLCTKLIQVLAKLSKEHKKQVIVTTHNPFILDGLNLADDDQRLFVVRRNMEGHTITNRIQPKAKTDVPLSEAWMRGYLGGLPNNF